MVIARYTPFLNDHGGTRARATDVTARINSAQVCGVQHGWGLGTVGAAHSHAYAWSSIFVVGVTVPINTVTTGQKLHLTHDLT